MEHIQIQFDGETDLTLNILETGVISIKDYASGETVLIRPVLIDALIMALQELKEEGENNVH